MEYIYKFLDARNITDENHRKAHIERVKNIRRKYSDDPNLGEFLIKLNTRYEDRDEVKRRRAWWSERKRAWYISEQNDLSFFKKWLPKWQMSMHGTLFIYVGEFKNAGSAKKKFR